MYFGLFFSRSDRSAASISLLTYQAGAAWVSVYSFGHDIVKAERLESGSDSAQDQSFLAHV